MLAADSGTTAAIVVALIAFLGVLSGNVVTWNKIRVDRRTAKEQLTQEREKSNIEIAHNVMTQTVTMLDARLKTERETHAAEIKQLRADHAEELAKVREEHDRDVSRLERALERKDIDYQQCRRRTSELFAHVRRLEREKEQRDRRES